MSRIPVQGQRESGVPRRGASGVSGRGPREAQGMVRLDTTRDDDAGCGLPGHRRIQRLSERDRNSGTPRPHEPVEKTAGTIIHRRIGSFLASIYTLDWGLFRRTILSVVACHWRIASRGEIPCDLRSESGKTIWRVLVSRLDPDVNLILLIPTSGVPTGYYDAVLQGVTGRDATDLDHYHFAVRRE